MWQTLVANCMNVCIHVNKSSFKPMSVILFIHGTLGSLSPLWAQLHLLSGPVHKQSPQNCCHPWESRLCTLADCGNPIEKVLLVTIQIYVLVSLCSVKSGSELDIFHVVTKFTVGDEESPTYVLLPIQNKECAT